MNVQDKKPMIAWNGLFIIAMIFGGILLSIIIFSFVMIGPGLPKDQNFAATMVSPQSMIFQNCSDGDKIFEKGSEFCIEQVSLEHYPQFHELTPMTSFVIFRNMNTSGKRVAAFWQFTSKGDFAIAERQLCKFLQGSGGVSIADLDLNHHKIAIRHYHQNYPEKRIDQIPNQITGTAFTGKETAGYFFVVNQPISKTRDDFFIEYIGLVGDTNLTANSSDLEYLIAMQGDMYYLFNGNIQPLGCSKA